jgi:hypothetical protein
MSNPRVIAATASAALIAGVGAGATVYAVDLVTSNDLAPASTTQAEDAPGLTSPQDDRTTVYRAPADDHDDDDDDDDDGSQQFQPAPPTTQWDSGSTTSKNKSNTSKSS